MRLVQKIVRWAGEGTLESPSVQVPNDHLLTQNLHYNYSYPEPKPLNVLQVWACSQEEMVEMVGVPAGPRVTTQTQGRI